MQEATVDLYVASSIAPCREPRDHTRAGDCVRSNSQAGCLPQYRYAPSLTRAQSGGHTIPQRPVRPSSAMEDSPGGAMYVVLPLALQPPVTVPCPAGTPLVPQVLLLPRRNSSCQGWARTSKATAGVGGGDRQHREAVALGRTTSLRQPKPSHLLVLLRLFRPMQCDVAVGWV